MCRESHHTPTCNKQQIQALEKYLPKLKHVQTTIDINPMTNTNITKINT